MKKTPKNSQIIIYKTEDGRTKIDVRFDNETVWLTQKLLAELFQVTVPTINEHIKNIYKESELEDNSTIRKFRIVQKEGKREISRDVDFYNLDMIIAVGYRVKSSIATSFRQWATQRLSEYIVKGFVLDDERLKNPDLPFDYFEELTKRISDIRTSEKRFYRKITDIYATSVDYDPASKESLLFFKTVQNKVHWAITGQTAPEIIVSRVNSTKPQMGLTSWRNVRPRREDIAIAKNYLNEEELLALNNLVEQYLVFAEGQARRRIPMHMKDWIKKLNDFLTINDREILAHAGKVSHEEALKKAEKEYDIFHHRQNASFAESDFDREMKKILKVKKRIRKGKN